MFEKDIYIERRKALKSIMGEGIVLFVGNRLLPMNYKDNTFPFRQDSSFLYFIGIDQPDLIAIIDLDSGEEVLFGDDYALEDIIWVGDQVTLEEKSASSGIGSVRPLKDLEMVLSDAKGKKRNIHYAPVYQSDNKITLSELMGVSLEALNSGFSLELIHAIVKLRSVKEPIEVAEIEKACHTGYLMHLTAMKMAAEGITEQEITGFMEGLAIAGGGMVSYPIILTQRGQVLHNHMHDRVLRDGNLMLVDAGAETAMHYASDFTRTTPVSGSFTAQQKSIYEIVLGANNLATELSKPGVKYLDVHFAVARYMTVQLKALGLMKGDVDEAVKAGAHALFFPHGLGHMMGLDVHDMEDLGQIYVGYDDETRPVDQFGTAYLRLGRKLEEGFVITNEPGLYFIDPLIDKWSSEKNNSEFINFNEVNRYRGFGGIRLEDDLLITSNGAKILGKRLPITPDEVTKACR